MIPKSMYLILLEVDGECFIMCVTGVRVGKSRVSADGEVCSHGVMGLMWPNRSYHRSNSNQSQKLQLLLCSLNMETRAVMKETACSAGEGSSNQEDRFRPLIGSNKEASWNPWEFLNLDAMSRVIPKPSLIHLR